MARRPPRLDKLVKYLASANIVVSGQIEVNSVSFLFGNVLAAVCLQLVLSGLPTLNYQYRQANLAAKGLQEAGFRMLWLSSAEPCR